MNLPLCNSGVVQSIFLLFRKILNISSVMEGKEIPQLGKNQQQAKIWQSNSKICLELQRKSPHVFDLGTPKIYNGCQPSQVEKAMSLNIDMLYIIMQYFSYWSCFTKEPRSKNESSRNYLTKTCICLHSEYRRTIYHFVSVLILIIFYKISFGNI